MAKKPDSTQKKHALTPEMLPHIWKPGESGNPMGRPKGTRNQFSESFCRDMLAEWEEGGRDAIRTVRATDPSTFLRVAASIIPKQFTLDEGESALERIIDQLTDSQLDEVITGLSLIGHAEKAGKGKTKAAVTERSGSVH